MSELEAAAAADPHDYRTRFKDAIEKLEREYGYTYTDEGPADEFVLSLSTASIAQLADLLFDEGIRPLFAKFDGVTLDFAYLNTLNATSRTEAHKELLALGNTLRKRAGRPRTFVKELKNSNHVPVGASGPLLRPPEAPPPQPVPPKPTAPAPAPAVPGCQKHTSSMNTFCFDCQQKRQAIKESPR